MLLAIATAASSTLMATPVLPPTNAPDGGASAALLALGSLGLVGFRRWISKR